MNSGWGTIYDSTGLHRWIFFGCLVILIVQRAIIAISVSNKSISYFLSILYPPEHTGMTLKSLVLIITILFFTPIVSYGDERQNYCKHIGDVARAAMAAMHAGVPLDVMLSLVSDETAAGVVRAAYEYPRETSVEDQKASTKQLVELVISHCVKDGNTG